MALRAINPASGETNDEMTAQQVGDIIDTVHKTFLAWRGTPSASAPSACAGRRKCCATRRALMRD